MKQKQLIFSCFYLAYTTVPYRILLELVEFYNAFKFNKKVTCLAELFGFVRQLLGATLLEKDESRIIFEKGAGAFSNQTSDSVFLL